ncbi:DUF427 domain-containing protein [Chthonobacter rhizosphaerae]|uniref:DUF427 domain-containing protein n=1 Tax=Chthonobacter rhizosphaerae TaxID=2735553 RepID=UPI0015EF8F72|nr:DUF427 domain-containing protein [Chthonobacter rhizosphaerae]
MTLLPREDVNDFPTIPHLERVLWPVVVRHKGERIAASLNAWRLLEKGKPPVVLVPPEDVTRFLVSPSNRVDVGDGLGLLVFHDVIVGREIVQNAACTVTSPPPEMTDIANHYAFSPDLLDHCSVAGVEALGEGGCTGSWRMPNLTDAKAA